LLERQQRVLDVPFLGTWFKALGVKPNLQEDVDRAKNIVATFDAGLVLGHCPNQDGIESPANVLSPESEDCVARSLVIEVLETL
jgi:hypothetical protein